VWDGPVAAVSGIPGSTHGAAIAVAERTIWIREERNSVSLVKSAAGMVLTDKRDMRGEFRVPDASHRARQLLQSTSLIRLEAVEARTCILTVLW
jgi:hypothetical protein